MTAANDPDQEALIALVQQALDLMDRGQQPDLVALCAAEPQLLQPLAEVLGLAADLPALQQQAAQQDPLAGMLLAGRYRLHRCRGRGAMGVVYAARDEELQRDVAVKILDARLFRDPAAEQRFLREAEALAALRHPHVVAVYDRGRTPEGILFLVMELLDGVTLATVLERLAEGAQLSDLAAEFGLRETVLPRIVAHWAAGIADALAAAHAAGLVHRDVKPSNVLVCRDGRAVLLDFGIAAQQSAARLTATATTLGTPWYMAPEQVGPTMAQRVAPPLDVYGLGATLFHLLAGRAPYEGDAAAVLAAMPHRDPPPLLQLRRELPRDLVAIVEHCMEREPARRYGNAGLLAADLRAFLAHQPVSVRPLAPWRRRLRQWRRAPARPLAVVATALCLLAVVVVVPLQRERMARATAAAKLELYRSLPALLAVEGWPDERLLVAQENQQALELLQAILQIDAEDLTARLFRALLRLDLRDPTGAARDLQWLARHHGGSHLAALAERYLRADPAGGAKAIELGNLPPPASAAEWYIAGVHQLRARHETGFAQRADECLARAADELLPARDFRMFATAALAEQASGAERTQRVAFLYDETVALEQLYGGPTARTQAMRGVALVLQQRYAEAATCLEQSLALRPARHGPHQNLGICYRRLGRLAEAEQHLQQALALRPFAWNTQYELAQVALARGDHAAAQRWAERLPEGGGSMKPWLRPNLLGLIALDEAIGRRVADPQRSQAVAEQAAAAFAAAAELAPNQRNLVQQRDLALALQQQRLEEALVLYARSLLRGDAEVARSLANLAFLLPPELGARETAHIGAVLRRLAALRAGGDAALRNNLEKDIEELLRPYK
ncbi:MAG: protein kinase [Planctomycetes bacterium]|nr:protein kinase [Planctomycetota bacterium]